MFVALATHFGLGPEAEKLAYAYRVSPIWAETWLHAAKRSGFLQSEHVTLEDVLESGVASLYTEKGMTALRQLDELIERYRKLVSRVVTPDTPIFCAMMAQRPDQTEVGKEIWARLAARGGMPDDE